MKAFTRTDRFLALKTHPWLSKDFARMRAKHLTECMNFLAENAALDDDAFLLALNRWKLDQPEARDKIHPIQWGLLSQSIETRTNRKGQA